MDHRVMNKVLASLSAVRESNAREEDRRRLEALTRCPEIGHIMDERRNAVMKSVLSAFTAPADPDLAAKVESWNGRIRALLRENGFDENWLDPIFTCPDCEDSGYTGSGKKTLCKCALARYARLMEKEGASAQEESFEAFDLTVFPDENLPGSDISQRQYMQVIRNKCLEFSSALPHPDHHTILMYGGSGLGKTYLMRCIQQKAVDRGIPAMFVTANQFIRAARESIFSRNSEELDAITETPLLLLDDVGTEPLIESITVEQFFVLINDRQSKRLCTVLSTNLSLDEIKKRYTERVFSRLVDRRSCLTLHFVGKDIRLCQN